MERVIAIYKCIVDAGIGDEGYSDDEGADVGEASAHLLMQMTSLVRGKLIMQETHAGDALESNVKYRCNASKSLIDRIAQSIQFPISKFITGS